MFPDLNRPRVTVMTEVPGMAPEEVEALITFPLESALNGATGVQAVRSSSGVGISVVNVEFNWGTDIYVDRQIVAEKLSLVADRMPEGVKPQLAPISSIMGQIMIVGMWSEGNKTEPDGGPHAGRLGRAAAAVDDSRRLAGVRHGRRAQAVPGAGQPRPDCSPTASRLHEIEAALEKSNSNVTGGYLDGQGPNEFLVRSLGRIQSVEDLRRAGGEDSRRAPGAAGAGGQGDRRAGSQAGRQFRVRRGKQDGKFAGGPGVILTVNKQPGTDTRQLTERVTAALEELKASLPPDIRIAPELYQQKKFIDLAIENVDRRPARRRHPGGHHPVRLPAQLPHHVHHAHGHPAVDRGHGPGVQVVRHVDQHDDAGRPGRGHRRTGGRRHRGRGEHLPPAAREPAAAASPSRPCWSCFRPARKSATRSSSAR